MTLLQWYRRLWRQAASDLVRTRSREARRRFVEIHEVTRWWKHRGYPPRP